MPEKPEKFYVTTPIYYVNARPHIGHAYTTIVADVLARRHRLLGDDTFFLTGTDEHGQKIERSAAAAGIPPQQFTDQVSAEFRALWDRMGLTYSRYIRTTSECHKQGAQQLFRELYNRGFIYLSTYTGSYCVSDEAFVDLPSGTPCPDCGRPLETVTEENFFFKLSEFQLPLLNLIESNQLLITPDSARNEVLSFVRCDLNKALTPTTDVSSRPEREARGGETPVFRPELHAASGQPQLPTTAAGSPYVPGALKDLSISRSSFTWGIPVPEDVQRASGTQQNHVIYVWLDALANYITAIGYGSDNPAQQAEFQKYWPADLHLVGKEITRFHCVYWPAFLLAAGLETPKQITANGWLLFDNAKMSKSKGNVVRTETILDAFGTLCPPVHPATGTNDNSTAGQGTSEEGTAGQGTNKEGTARQRTNEEGTAGQGTNEEGTADQGTNEEGTNRKGTNEEGTNRKGTNEEGTNRKGTASAVPQTAPGEAASAAEVRPPTPHERDLFAADVLRYFLLREIPFGQDGSFSFDALITRYNADLANGYGNLVSRVLSLIHRSCKGLVPNRPSPPPPFRLIDVRDDDPRLRLQNLSGLATETQMWSQTEIQNLNFAKAIGLIWTFVAKSDISMSLAEPWKLAKSTAPADRDLLNGILYEEAESIRLITALLYPVLPYATARVWAQLGLGDIEESARNGELNNLTWGGLKPGTKLGPLGPIFPRADKGLAQTMIDMEESRSTATQKPEAPLKAAATPAPAAPITSNPSDPAAPPRTSSLDEPNSGLTVGGSNAETATLPTTPGPHTEAHASGPFAAAATSPNGPVSTDEAPTHITIDDFMKVELRVAQILVAERIPKADKLLRLEVDLGIEKRQILSGIAQWYTPEELIGRRIVVVANLAPRKMRGLESHGMLLAASEGQDGKPILATFGEYIALGSRVR